MTTRIDRLVNALGAMGCPDARSVAVLVDEVWDQIREDDVEAAQNVVGIQRGVLSEARSLVEGERQEDYGDPVVCMGNWAEILRILYGWDIDAHKASVAMSLLKHVREAHRPKRDNRVDSPAYMHIADLAYERLFGDD